ncbi:5'-3' exonuclease [[Mycoplasma] anseris]|uniref:5'-3' exonuclease n=1 Tax=[Mycoplasma] anseris TaxID=92400 RepID=A0A2Z4NDF8_9BACT|nr:5'-3' exonuclease H3TH domain-containing protein [[Mycoplasma] anseris]AWX69538.1 flap endonuclease [[Mycoplasma] anseris]
MVKNKILLIDGTYLAYRSYYATMYATFNGQAIQTSKGFPTNAIVGFFNSFFSLIKTVDPEFIFFAFDSRKKTFRHELFTEYKGNRQKAPVDFHKQLEKIQELLTSCKFANEYVDGFEADDIIAKLTTKFQNDHQILIYSADQDLNQLINENVAIIKKYKSENIILNLNNFNEYYDFKPRQVIDYKALVGDSSDNFKGVPGLGPKTVSGLLKEFDTLENIYQNLDNIRPKVKEKLIDYKQDAQRDKYLATLRTDFEIKTNDLSNLKLSNMQLTNETFKILDDLELNEIKNKLISLEIF